MIVEKTYYILMHRPTGNVMPETKKYYTTHEFVSPRHSKFPPRLFVSEESARISLGMFCAGEWSARYNFGSSVDRSYSRPRREYEIVPVRVSSIKESQFALIPF